MNFLAKRYLFVLLLLSYALTTLACHADFDHMISINAEAIPLEVIESEYIAFSRAFQNIPEPGALFRSAALQSFFIGDLITQTIIRQELAKHQITVAEAELRRVIEANLSDLDPAERQELFAMPGSNPIDWLVWLQKEMLTEKFCEALWGKSIHIEPLQAKIYYDQHIDTFLQAEKRGLSQILVRDQAEAETVMQALASGQDFGTLARQFSLAPEAENGGQMGLFEPGQLLRELDQAVLGLQEKQVSPPIETSYGRHILRLDQFIPAKAWRFQEVKERISERLRQEELNQRFKRRIQELARKARITVDWEKFYYFLQVKKELWQFHQNS
jgi:hypothetical protein